MEPLQKFIQERQARIVEMGKQESLKKISMDWSLATAQYGYTYNFSWMGRPIIQFPQDVLALQELIWQVKPDLIIETGIAHGGSLILSASLLSLIDYCEAVETKSTLDPLHTRRHVLGIDIDIRTHNRVAIEAHPMSHRIEMIQGSSVSSAVINKVHEIAQKHQKILVILDSNHTHEHVLAELEAYAPLVSINSYCVVFDTSIEDAPDSLFPDRLWGKGNNPKTAVWEYLKTHPEFEINKDIEHKLLITVAPDGYLKRVSQ